MDGKGVFLYATRGAKPHLESLLSGNRLTLADVDLLIEHQANFAMLPLTLEQVLSDGGPADREAVARFLADKMVTNIHLRGNCSVVCMQRLPYDLARGALKPDTIQGLAVNRNVDRLRDAGLTLYDSVGAGMTRSSFLRRAYRLLKNGASARDPALPAVCKCSQIMNMLRFPKYRDVLADGLTLVF